MAETRRLGEHLVDLLSAYGVSTVFGIPGVHNVELYRGLSGSGIRHISPRHEQGAGFMADAYARVTGRPGVCFVITGPGVTNIATAMGQAYQDSIPLLVISSVNATPQLGHGLGYLHELPDQSGLAANVAAFSHTLLRPEDLPAVLARAFAIFDSGRPRPVHIEIPTDIIGKEFALPTAANPPKRMAPGLPAGTALDEAAKLLQGARRSVILLGGGAVQASAPVAKLAERLDAPCVMTINARGLLPRGHRLGVPASPSLKAVRKLVEAADVVLAIGTELGPTDYNMYDESPFTIPGRLIRIEIDPVQMARNFAPDVCLLGGGNETLLALLDRLGGETSDRDGGARAEAARVAALAELSPESRRKIAFVETVRDALPGAIITGDSTQAVYAGNLFYEPDAPVGWFNSATGYGTLGYALPAAIGAKLGAPERPVVCLTGDGGVQFTLGELGSAIDADAPIVALVWNNRGYQEIKTYMLERGIAPAGVDLATPDFCKIAEAYGWRAERLAMADDLPRLLKQAAARSGPTLIEIDEAVVMELAVDSP